MSDQDLIKAFLERFAYIDEGFKLKVSASKVRDFMQEQQLSMTFQSFNKLLRCEGRSTNNQYVYDLIYLSNAVGERVSKEREKNFSENAIKVLNYYGSKRNWREEYELLYKHCADLGCTVMVDMFAGSGFLGLLASKMGLFKEIRLNELSGLVFNYHLVQKDERSFKKFIEYVGRFSVVDKSLFAIMKKDLGLGKRERRGHIIKGDATKATELFIVKHYAHSGQGGYIKDRMAPAWYVEALGETHKLYEQVDLSHMHYRKVLKRYMQNKESLLILDPPYLSETRVQKKSYNLEFSTRQHRTLLQLLTSEKLEAKVVLCGYHNSLYERYFMKFNEKHGICWHEVALLKSGNREIWAEAKERIWINFDMSSLINEYWYLFELVW